MEKKLHTWGRVDMWGIAPHHISGCINPGKPDTLLVPWSDVKCASCLSCDSRSYESTKAKSPIFVKKNFLMRKR